MAADGSTVRTISSYDNPYGYTSRRHDDESGLMYFRARYYDTKTGEFGSPDPMGYVDGMSIFRGYFVCGSVDPSGLDDYKIGTDDPQYTPDKGSNKHGSRDANDEDYDIWNKWSEKANSVLTQFRGPNAARHMRHYLDNTGNDLDIRLSAMIADSKSAKELYEYEKAKAKAFAETLPITGYEYWPITSGKLSRGAVKMEDSVNWYYAVHGYSSWGKGHVQVQCVVGNDGAEYRKYKMHFEYYFRDRYNWDKGKAVILNGVLVSDSELARLHNSGLAKEYDMYGRVRDTFEWSKQTKAPSKPPNGTRR